MNISLTPELEQFVRSTVENGKYSSASEVILAALQLLKEQEILGVINPVLSEGKQKSNYELLKDADWIGVSVKYLNKINYKSSTQIRRSLFPIPYSLFPIPYSLFPIPYSLFPVPCSLFPVP
ncbi:MAG TPA: type II toxin-antitoxin system ParD family antitoxin [Candidatus Obscuribacterales bacterium]